MRELPPHNPQERIDYRNDQHLIYTYDTREQAHTPNEACWCRPTIQFVSPNGSRVWSHRRVA